MKLLEGGKPAKEENTVKKSTRGGGRKRAEKRGRMCERVQGGGFGGRVCVCIICRRVLGESLWGALHMPAGWAEKGAKSSLLISIPQSPPRRQNPFRLSDQSSPRERLHGVSFPREGHVTEENDGGVIWGRRTKILTKPRLDSHGKKKKKRKNRHGR